MECTKEYLEDFLNDKQKEAILDYDFIPSSKLKTHKIKKGDYLKYMYMYNYQFIEGGIIIQYNYPIIIVKSYEYPKSIYSIDLSKIFVFHKKNKTIQTRREYFEEYLKYL